MGLTYRNFFHLFISFTLVFCSVFSPIPQLRASDFVQTDSLGEYQDIFEEFEREADAENKGFLRKWCHSLKSWFKKRVVSLIKKLIKFKRCNNIDECAYTAARLKIKIDKKLYNTGSIYTIISNFENSTPGDKAHISKFGEKVLFYYLHPGVKPGMMQSKEMDDIPDQAVFGYVEMFCGALICMIPLPGCQTLGAFLIGHGYNEVYQAYAAKKD